MLRRLSRLFVPGLVVAVLFGVVAVLPVPAGEEQPAATETTQIPVPAQQKTYPQFVTTKVDDVTFSIGFQIAHLRMSEGAEILPLVVGMQNFKHKMWSLKLKDFQLTDAGGTVIEPLTLKQLRKQYRGYSKDYQFIDRTTTINQMLPSAEFAGGVRGEQRVNTIDTGRTFYQHTLFYPTPGDTAVYSATLDFKNFFFDLLYYRDIAGKLLRMSVPGKKRRPQLELVFTVKPLEQ
jgi:hypothetical protein